MRDEEPRLTYVMGTGRSGSTVLEVLLSQAPDTFGAGELSFLVQDGFLADRACSCGRPTRRCSVWSAVLAETRWQAAELTELAELFRRVDHHRNVPALLAGAGKVADLADYRAANKVLLNAIAAVTGARRIIDSSKYVARALALDETMHLDVLALTRRPAGLMASWQKVNRSGEQPPKSPTEMLAYYTYVATSVRLASDRLARVLPLSYEQLMADPLLGLRRIGGFTGQDLGEVLARVQRDETFDVGHMVTGNRLRRAGGLRLQRHHATARPTGRRARLAVAVMNAQRRVLGL